MYNLKEDITGLVDKPVGSRYQDLERPLCPQDDTDGQAKQVLVGVVEPHSDHVVLGPRWDEQLFTHRKVLQQDS